MIVRVPASSANLGPGFDTLGMALTLYARVGLATDGPPPAGAVIADARHPATVANRRAGGSGALWIHAPIPMGRGLGFSGAVRVAGAALAAVERGEPIDPDEVLQIAADLEGHADNAAASVFGGVVATAAGRCVRIPSALEPAVVVWVPSFVTATDESRRTLPDTVPFADAVFNVGRAALLVAAFAAGDVGALREATRDRLHQDRRLARAAPSRVALETMIDQGAWAAWLSGSGPTVAALCPPDAADALAVAVTAAAPEGHAKVLRIDPHGVAMEARPEPDVGSGLGAGIETGADAPS